mmetsp:Transcript_57914/g.119610  ORF Transcript_57914/g.119610 Transcript_57914/m.119610 type:complete len:82 (-) Transcript_57914:330-575(-)
MSEFGMQGATEPAPAVPGAKKSSTHDMNQRLQKDGQSNTAESSAFAPVPTSPSQREQKARRASCAHLPERSCENAAKLFRT